MRTFDGQFGPGRVVFGTGTIGVVPEELRRLGVGRPLVLATSEQADLAQQVATAVGAAAVFSGAKMHTPVEVTREALAVLDEAGADSVVSVGGGSTTGLGKAVASRAAVPHLVVPTTYAGSEVTPVLGETADGEKVTRSGPEILPNTVVYDVDLTTTLPWSMTLTSAVNAMAHAVEALYAPDRGVETDAMATDAIGALATGLRALHGAGGHVAPDGSDGDHGASTSPQTPAESLAPDRRDASRVLDARADLLYGAWLAGRCLGAVGMGLHHKLCHTLGGSFGLPHAPTHTVVLPHAMAYNAAAAPEAMTLAASALQVHEAPSGLHELVGELGGPTDLQALGFSLDDIARAADLATARPYPNPDRGGAHRASRAVGPDHPRTGRHLVPRRVPHPIHTRPGGLGCSRSHPAAVTSCAGDARHDRRAVGGASTWVTPHRPSASCSPATPSASSPCPA